MSTAARSTRRHLRALRRNQDGRVKAIAERALEGAELAPVSPLDG